jgi:cytochrome P450
VKAGQSEESEMSSALPGASGYSSPVTPGWYGADPQDPHYVDDPYPGYRVLRERQPVNLTPKGHWRISRYDDVVRLLRELPVGMRLSNGLLPGQAVEEEPGRSGAFMLQQDPPAHTRLRKLVSRAFTPRAVESWRPRVEAIAHRLVDAVAAAGRMELVADYARPIPATLICELLGVPVEHRDRFTAWTADATHALATSRNLSDSPEVAARVEQAVISLAGYFDGLIAERRVRRGDDLLGVLIAAEEDGDRLSEAELLSQSIGLLIAGFETTIGLIGNGLVELMRHPEEMEKLRAEPVLVESAVEECLRYAAPVPMTVRVTHTDCDFDGIVIPRDSQVFAMLAGANRDPERFVDPERFDIGRYARAPETSAHLSFGGGAHYCLGAHLARMEAQVAFAVILERSRDLELEGGRIEWGRSLFRVPGRIPIRFRATGS